MLKPIRGDKRTVYEQIVHVIRSYIVKGDLKPGDKLPSERELAATLNVSRASVREAVKMLSAEGFVEVKHGQGIFISDKENPDTIIHKLDKFSMDEKTIRDFFEVRLVLELQAVEWVIKRASTDNLKDLEKLIEDTKQDLSQKDKGVLLSLAEHDTKFHELLAEYAGNHVLLRSMHSLLDILSEVRLKCLQIEGRPIKSLEEHEEIVKALLDRDLSRAKEVTESHIKSLEKDILNTFAT